MTTISRHVDATPEQLWEILSDGWLYPLWVVGASRMRDVDAGWPRPGAKLHHSVGNWPLLLDDTTSSLAADPGRRLELKARGWPFGTALVTLELEPAAGGTEVRMSEDLEDGPAAMLTPPPVRAPLIRWRNAESLRRLAMLAEGRVRHTP